MKKSITILSIFLLGIFSSCHREREVHNLSKMEIRSAFQPFQYPLLSLSYGISCSGEDDSDPPRKDPWQWINTVEKLMELLEYFSSGSR